MAINTLEIHVSKSKKKIKLLHKNGSKESVLLEANIVSGCEGSGTPSGKYKAGKWIKDKTNPHHGPKPWSQDQWANPYGPYFLPLHNIKNNQYTTYGIHGTRGPLIGNFEKPPLPEALVGWFVGDDTAKYLYCSHGCIRLSNQNIEKLFTLTAQPKYVGVQPTITIE